MKNIVKSVLLFALLLSATSCVQRTNGDAKAIENHKIALQDSIKIVKNQIDSCNNVVELLADKVGVWGRDFTNVSNPREAASYMIYTPARNKYPLTGTGIIARINDSGQFELIASYVGAPFDQVEVTSGSCTAATDIVPQDQALNYRVDNFSTVSFTGNKANEVGQLISDNELNNITLAYLRGKVVGSIKLDAASVKEISYTYLFYKDMAEMHRTSQKVKMLSQKLLLLQRHLDNQ